MNYAIQTQAEQVEERMKLSKYFRKHYIIEDANLFETACLRCGCIFSVDYKWFKYEYRDDGDFAIIHCPYCGKVFKECV